jgi:D-lactate dehydrogenase
MKAILFSAHEHDRAAFNEANAVEAQQHDLTFIEAQLNEATAQLARGNEAIVVFFNNRGDPPTLQGLAGAGVRLIAARSAEHDNLDLGEAHECGLRAVYVPSYPPYAVAEQVLALLLSIVRHTVLAYERVREGNFSIEGLEGFDLHGKTFGVVGLGNIGQTVAAIALGMGCTVLAADPHAGRQTLPISVVPLNELLASSSAVTLHVPLVAATRHLIDSQRLERLQPNPILINTSRGALVDTTALINCLKERRLGGDGLDVYGGEGPVFYRDLSPSVVADDRLERLLSLPSVLMTPHIAREAVSAIAQTTLDSLTEFDQGRSLSNGVHA